MKLLMLAAYHHGHVYGGWANWIAHVSISATIHALIYGLVFRLMHRLTLGEAVVLVGFILLLLFAWGRSRDRRW